MIPRTLFGPEHEAFRDTVRRFVEREIAPHYYEWEQACRIPRDVWRKAGEAGLLLCEVPQALGGQGGDFLHATIVMEELATVGATGVFFGLHSDIVAPYLQKYARPAFAEHWLPRMASGQCVAAIAMTEPSAGSDLKAIRSTAVKSGDEYIVNGSKTFISNGQTADLVIVACKTDAEAGARGISLIAVEADRDGFRRGRQLRKLGLHSQDTSELFFDDVRVPADNLIGEPGQGFAMLMNELSQERLTQAIRAIAGAEAAIEWTLDYVQSREAFGKSIAAFQNTQFKLAELKAQVVAQRVFVDRCIELHLVGQFDSVDAAMVKMLSTELQSKAADECLQLFGGYGYMTEYPIARLWADARMPRIAGGSIEVMKTIIARSMLGRQ